MRCIPNWWERHITGIRDKDGVEIREGDTLDSEWPKGQYIIVWEPRDAAFKAYETRGMLHCDTTKGMAVQQWGYSKILIKEEEKHNYE